MKERQKEIEQHHSLHGLGKWHNARGNAYPSIDEVISIEQKTSSISNDKN